MKLKNKILNVIFGIILLIYFCLLYVNFGYTDNGIMLYFLIYIVLPSILGLYLILLSFLNIKEIIKKLKGPGREK